MVDTTQQRIDGAKFGLWLRAVGIRDDDARRIAIQSPGHAAIGGAVEHVVDILRASGPSTGAILEQTIDRARIRIDRQPMARIDGATGEPGAVVDGKLERVGAGRRANGHAHVRSAIEIVIGDVNIF
jgi:hypothetical protein